MKKRGYLYIPKKEKVNRDKVIKKPGDESTIVIASPELDKPPAKGQAEFQEGQSVELLIGNQTDIGYNALINGSREGLLYKNEVFQALRKGEHISGFIKKVREDGKMDLCLQKPGVEKVYDVSDKIIGKLKEQCGFIALDDKTSPEVIYRLFGTSKKTFKKAIGALYKRRLILIESDGIRLVKEDGI
jgi:predicted RNA-binding protein (virulence factor B family)